MLSAPWGSRRRRTPRRRTSTLPPSSRPCASKSTARSSCRRGSRLQPSSSRSGAKSSPCPGFRHRRTRLQPLPVPVPKRPLVLFAIDVLAFTPLFPFGCHPDHFPCSLPLANSPSASSSRSGAKTYTARSLRRRASQPRTPFVRSGATPSTCPALRHRRTRLQPPSRSGASTSTCPAFRHRRTRPLLLLAVRVPACPFHGLRWRSALRTPCTLADTNSSLAVRSPLA